MDKGRKEIRVNANFFDEKSVLTALKTKQALSPPRGHLVTEPASTPSNRTQETNASCRRGQPVEPSPLAWHISLEAQSRPALPHADHFLVLTLIKRFASKQKCLAAC